MSGNTQPITLSGNGPLFRFCGLVWRASLQDLRYCSAAQGGGTNVWILFNANEEESSCADLFHVVGHTPNAWVPGAFVPFAARPCEGHRRGQWREQQWRKPVLLGWPSVRIFTVELGERALSAYAYRAPCVCGAGSVAGWSVLCSLAI